METIYNIVGFVMVWLIIFISMSTVVYFTIKEIIEVIATKTKFFWKFIEFLYYYREFSEFVNNKEDRHPKAK